MRARIPDLEKLSQALANGDARRARYATAYALYRLSVLEPDAGERSAFHAGAIDRAQTVVDALVADPELAEVERVEALVLRSVILGVRADRSLLRRMWFGRQAHRAVGEARAIDPEHPRVLLQLGILLFHTPASFGGGPDAALPLLERARTGLDPTTHPRAEGAGPTWGWLDASAWLGQTHAARGDSAAARAVYLETLAHEPEMGWIRDRLLPALDAPAR